MSDQRRILFYILVGTTFSNVKGEWLLRSFLLSFLLLFGTFLLIYVAGWPISIFTISSSGALASQYCINIYILVLVVSWLWEVHINNLWFYISNWIWADAQIIWHLRNEFLTTLRHLRTIIIDFIIKFIKISLRVIIKHFYEFAFVYEPTFIIIIQMEKNFYFFLLICFHNVCFWVDKCQQGIKER